MTNSRKKFIICIVRVVEKCFSKQDERACFDYFQFPSWFKRDKSVSAIRNFTAFFRFKEEAIERIRIVCTGIALLLATFSGSAVGRSVTAGRAERAVRAWLGTDALSVQTDSRRAAKSIAAFTDESGGVIYYVVSIEPRGFVIVSADDEVEPIIAFSEEGDYDPSPSNPLVSLVAGDLKGRIAGVRGGGHLRGERRRARARRAKEKWERFAQLGQALDEEGESTEGAGASSISDTGAVSDVRVAPFLASKWGQYNVCSEPCFNYYTPGNYRAGCVPVTMAQVMRYYQYPRGAIGVEGFWIRKDNSDWYAAYTRGGNGSGGAYNWDDMALVPNCSTTATQRRAIGALCYDAAISVNSVFGPEISQADTLRAKDALVETFNFSDAVKGYNGGNNIGVGLIGMINPNLDARRPVIIGITGESGHAVVADGYGYNSSTLYHHLNMGWRGISDAWYNLPNIDSSPAYSIIYKCIYNISASDSHGEHVSGRVLTESGEPIANPWVYAQSADKSHEVRAQTYDNGIYAFDEFDSGRTYTIYVSAEGYKFTPKSITVGTSRDEAAVSGNIWGVDFHGEAAEALIGWWKLDESAGMVYAKDSAGVSDGTVYGGPAWLRMGVFGRAIQLDGERYVSISNESQFDLVDQITVSAWVKIDDLDVYWQTIVSKGDSAWRLSAFRGERRFHFGVTGAPDYVAVTSNASVEAGQWHHVCGTYDGAHLRLYIDGQLDPGGPVSYSGGITTNNFNVYIGENAEKPGRGWIGAIDEVRIHNYALKPGAVANLLCGEPAAGDVNHDCVVDMADYAEFTAAYLSRSGDPRWDPDCDISLPADGVIDMHDLNTFLSGWLVGDK